MEEVEAHQQNTLSYKRFHEAMTAEVWERGRRKEEEGGRREERGNGRARVPRGLGRGGDGGGGSSTEYVELQEVPLGYDC
jgi:hypothetical protein